MAQQFVEIKDGNESWKNSRGKYKAAEVWSVIRKKKENVGWHKLVWFNLNMPKHAFIAWLAMLNRLPTKDTLMAWGMEMEGNCVFCGEQETKSHLFFGCSFSQRIWKKVLQLCGLQRRVLNWEQEVQWAIQRLKGKALTSMLMRIAWSAFIYNIWRERNCRIYAQKSGTEEQILNKIKEVVRYRLAKLKNIQADSVNMFLHSSWGLTDSIFV